MSGRNALQPKPRLLDQARDLMRVRHYSFVTEKSYLSWMRQFILFHSKQHPLDLPTSAISDFLTYLARTRGVAPSTQNQALNALVFLYREVLRVNLGDLQGIEWAKSRTRVPAVFSRDEVANILHYFQGEKKLIAALLYGAGLRLSECLRLRRKDIDFERGQLAIWDSKSMKDRLVMLPKPLRQPLVKQLRRIRTLWEKDRAMKVPGVELPAVVRVP